MIQFARITARNLLAVVLIGNLAGGCGSLTGGACAEGDRVPSSHASTSLEGAWRLAITGGAPSPIWSFADGACLSVDQQVATAWRQGCEQDILSGSFEAREQSGVVEMEAVVRISGAPRLVRLVLNQGPGDTLAGRILLFGDGGAVQACAPVELSPG